MSSKHTRFSSGASMPVEFICCPVCQKTLNLHRSGGQSVMVCSSNHSFDIAKEGYLNLLMRAHRSFYHKAQFEARHKIICQSELFQPLIVLLKERIAFYERDLNSGEAPVLDAGAGEGSFLTEVMRGQSRLAVGLDIAKQGILLAAKKNQNDIWIVGDLSRMPFHSDTFGVILNILSPANYEEFDRVLMPNGILLKVIPRKLYLEQLRTYSSEAKHGGDTFNSGEAQ